MLSTAQAPAPTPSPPPELPPSVYDHLRALAALYLAGKRGTILQATALVHEAFIRLARSGPTAWNDEVQFAGLVASVMRRVLVDELRRTARAKRGGGWARLSLRGSEPVAEAPTLDLLALDEALTELARRSERQARVVELRYFGGLTSAQAAGILGVSLRTVEGDWAVARAWLRARIEDGP